MIKLIAAALFLLVGIFAFFTETVGFFRFNHVMMRIHAAGVGDTLGFVSVAVAVAILTGKVVACLKIILIVSFLLLTNPVLTHLIAELELRISKQADSGCTKEEKI